MAVNLPQFLVIVTILAQNREKQNHLDTLFDKDSSCSGVIAMATESLTYFHGYGGLIWLHLHIW